MGWDEPVKVRVSAIRGDRWRQWTGKGVWRKLKVIRGSFMLPGERQQWRWMTGIIKKN